MEVFGEICRRTTATKGECRTGGAIHSKAPCKGPDTATAVLEEGELTRLRFYYGPIIRKSSEDCKKSLTSKLGILEAKKEQGNSGIVKPSGAEVGSESTMFAEHNGWIVFDYWGWTTVQRRTADSVWYRMGMRQAESVQSLRVPYSMVVGLQASKGILCIIIREGRPDDNDLRRIVMNISLALDDTYRFEPVELTRLQVQQLSQRYQDDEYITRVITQRLEEGTATFRAVKKDIQELREIQDSEDVFETSKNIALANWLSLAIRVYDEGYELKLTKRPAVSRSLTINPLRMKKQFRKTRAAKLMDHVASYLLKVKKPYALKS